MRVVAGSRARSSSASVMARCTSIRGDGSDSPGFVRRRHNSMMMWMTAARTLLWAGFDYAQRFAHHRAAVAELFDQGALGRQTIAIAQLTRADAGADAFGDALSSLGLFDGVEVDGH